MIAAATSMVPATITGPSALGRMWRTTCRGTLAPSARAASTNSFSRSEKNCARTSRATGIQRRPPITTHDEDEDADLGAERGLQGCRGTGRSAAAAAAAAAATRKRSVSHISAVSTAAARDAGDGADRARRRRSPSASPRGRPRARCGRRRACARRCPARGRRCRTGAPSDGVCQARGEVDVVDRQAARRAARTTTSSHHERQHEQARQRHLVAAEAPPGLGPRRDVAAGAARRGAPQR